MTGLRMYYYFLGTASSTSATCFLLPNSPATLTGRALTSLFTSCKRAQESV
ncbi:hypothetical protein COMA1_11357 [Candidatus Nitrospira nitrosa]|uniref:Uncharacterized protein n=1 Tax=Candidatus Nitrospira nitrosa TaxID=1742972 RepID=A0A0S4LD31_9BACT|nr:hypothetical protein COMA1_11357 [Candidatus Nitrospira nitrosa]